MKIARIQNMQNLCKKNRYSNQIYKTNVSLEKNPCHWGTRARSERPPAGPNLLTQPPQIEHNSPKCCRINICQPCKNCAGESRFSQILCGINLKLKKMNKIAFPHNFQKFRKSILSKKSQNRIGAKSNGNQLPNSPDQNEA